MLTDAELLQHYLDTYGPDAGPWNLSPANLYIQSKVRQFFETNFSLSSGLQVCNVGIGAGDWDEYLSFLTNGHGTLTSIDIDQRQCSTLQYRQARERNPNPSTVLCTSIHQTKALHDAFDVVTIIGSTVHECRDYKLTLQCCLDLLKQRGSLFYMDFDRLNPLASLESFLAGRRYQLETLEKYRDFPKVSFYCAKISKAVDRAQ